mgnify:CR=1 FL=1
MEEKKKSQRIRMLELLTNEENNLMLYDALHDKDLTKFFYLLKQGYALTPFLLNCMIDYGYEKHIEKALCVCDRCSFAIYDFFCIYWGVDKTEDFFVKNSYTKVIQKRFSTKSLVKYQLWELLAERREYVVLAEHGQIELLKKLKQENPSDHLLGVREALRKVNAVEALAELKDWIGLAGLPEGELKLFELKEWRYVDFDKVSFLRKVPQEQLLQEVYEAGGGDFLFWAGGSSAAAWSKFCHPLLLARKYYQPFISQKLWAELAKELQPVNTTMMDSAADGCIYTSVNSGLEQGLDAEGIREKVKSDIEAATAEVKEQQIQVLKDAGVWDK